MHIKLTKDNIDTLYNNIRRVITEEQYDQRNWHIGRFASIRGRNVYLTRTQPDDEIVSPRLFNLYAEKCRGLKVESMLFTPKDYHLYQCRDGINIWTNEDIMPLDYINLGSKTYLLLRSVEKQNFPVKTEKGNYYEFRIREVI